MPSIILLVVFIILLLLRTPISITMGISVLCALIVGDYPLQMLPQYIASGIQSYPLMAVPFFILAGNIMNVTGVTTRIFDFASTFIGHIKGGLAQVNIFASMIFAGISGATLADVGGLGTIEIKAMKNYEYSDKVIIGATTASAVVGPIIPPSITLVIYAVQAEVSIGRLFLAGIVPGGLIGLFLMLFIYFLAATGKEKMPVLENPNIQKMVKSFRKGFFAVMAPVVILWGIVGGVVTPTEAGALAVFYALFVGVIYGDIDWQALPNALLDSVLTTSLIMLLIGFATVMGWIIAADQIPAELAKIMLSISENKIVLLLIINLFLLVLGCVLETIPALIIMVPVLLPVVKNLGMDPVHFGIVICFNLTIGLITPPMGIALYLVSSLVGVSFEKAAAAVTPYLIILILSLFVITFVPQLSLFIPNMVMP